MSRVYICKYVVYDWEIKHKKRFLNLFYFLYHSHFHFLSIGIPMAMNCALLLADFFLHTCTYEADFLQGLLKNKDRILASFRYIDDVLSPNNSLHITPVKSLMLRILLILKTASYFEYHLEIANRGRLKTKLYNKRDDFASLSSVAIFQHHQLMEFAFHNSILELVHTTVIFWTELNCLRKSYLNKTTLFLG